MERLTYNATYCGGASNEKQGSRSKEERIAKILRIITVPPIMALLLVTVLYAVLKERAFAEPIRYFEAIFTLAILPVLSYPICMLIPSLKKRGRKTERSLSIVFSIVGYLMGTLFAIFAGGTRVELTLYLTYIMSGALMGLFSFALRFRASGHACGSAGPFTMLAHQLGVGWTLGFLLLIPVFVSSIRLKRHTVAELIAGGAISACSYFIAVIIVARFF